MKTFPLLLCLLISTTFYAQKKDKNNPKKEESKWEVANPGKDFNYKTHSFATTEGTWMNLDVSPDGKEIVFDFVFANPFAR